METYSGGRQQEPPNLVSNDVSSDLKLPETTRQ